MPNLLDSQGHFAFCSSWSQLDCQWLLHLCLLCSHCRSHHLKLFKNLSSRAISDIEYHRCCQHQQVHCLPSSLSTTTYSQPLISTSTCSPQPSPSGSLQFCCLVSKDCQLGIWSDKDDYDYNLMFMKIIAAYCMKMTWQAKFVDD